VSAGFSDDIKELVRARTDIAELIGESVALEPQRGGREFKGLCPFHDDHNPSFTVSPERQSYKCWSCGEGGDCFSFVMQIEGLGFRETLERLAERAGVELPKQMSRRPNAGGDDKATLLEIVAWADNEFHHCLKSSPAGQPARDYLAGRGFTAEWIDRFRLGCHPGGWDWLLNRAKGRYTPQQLARVRLVRERDGGSGYYDDFRNRVLFSIRDLSGRPVAFGGRILPGDDHPDAPKYLNSPESELFVKSRLLYGFDVARDAIRRSGVAVVTEGYTDCVTAHQHGIGNAIAVLGTALTEMHVTALKRFARTVVLVFDDDGAGRKAAERSLAKFLAQEVDLRVLTLPGGQDPADFLENQGAEAFQTLINDAPEAWEYQLRCSIERYGVNSIDARQRVLDDMLDLLTQAPKLSGSVREDIILARLSQRLRLDELIVRKRLKEGRSQTRVRVDAPQIQQEIPDEMMPEQQPNKYNLVEWELLEIIFADPQTVETIRQEVAPDEFQNDGLRRLLYVCFDLAERGLEPTYERVTATVEVPELKRLAAKVDEQSRIKNIADKLKDDVANTGTDAKPRFLGQAVETMKWRRREQSHELSKGQMAQQDGTQSELDSDAIALLRRATEFHGERSKKQTSN
jgi:DNA primase